MKQVSLTDFVGPCAGLYGGYLTPQARRSSTECQVAYQTVGSALKTSGESTVKCLEHENTLYIPSK